MRHGKTCRVFTEHWLNSLVNEQSTWKNWGREKRRKRRKRRIKKTKNLVTGDEDEDKKEKED